MRTTLRVNRSERSYVTSLLIFQYSYAAIFYNAALRFVFDLLIYSKTAFFLYSFRLLVIEEMSAKQKLQLLVLE